LRNLEEFNGKHRGETCYILGPGPSVYSQDINSLKDQLVITVNSGCVAALWAPYFVSDDEGICKWSYYDDLFKSNTTMLLYEYKLGYKAVAFGDRAVLFRHRKGIHIPDVYEHKVKKNHLGETRTSLGTGIMIAHIMGCDRIILLGVDCCRLNGLRYFWQFPQNECSFQFAVPFRKDTKKVDLFKKCKYQGDITDTDLMEISRTWQAFGSAVNERCKVYNGSPISRVKIFPKVDF
jgi:hypothetical protein